MLLSKSTTTYWISHKPILESFLMKWDPKLTGMIEFGDDDYEWDVYYPKKEKLYKFPRYKKIKLLSIKYKCRADVGDLAGM